MIGQLRACFDDGQSGCVEGRFAASTCHSSIDIDMLGERHTDLEIEGRP